MLREGEVEEAEGRDGKTTGGGGEVQKRVDVVIKAREEGRQRKEGRRAEREEVLMGVREEEGREECMGRKKK